MDGFTQCLLLLYAATVFVFGCWIMLALREADDERWPLFAAIAWQGLVIGVMRVLIWWGPLPHTVRGYLLRSGLIAATGPLVYLLVKRFSNRLWWRPKWWRGRA